MVGSTLPVRGLIIHAADSAERSANVERLVDFLGRVGLESVDVVDAVRPDDAGPLYSPGEWGCYQSHAKCLRIAGQAPPGTFTLVVEDDIEFRADAARIRAVIESGLRQEWDLLYLGHSGWTPLRSWDVEVTSREWLPVRGMIFGTTCFLVAPEGYPGLVEEYEALAHESPLSGGGVGADGAFAELSYRHPALVRLVSPTPWAEEVIGTQSLIRESAKQGRLRSALLKARRRLRRFVETIRRK